MIAALIPAMLVMAGSFAIGYQPAMFLPHVPALLHSHHLAVTGLGSRGFFHQVGAGVQLLHRAAADLKPRWSFGNSIGWAPPRLAGFVFGISAGIAEHRSPACQAGKGDHPGVDDPSVDDPCAASLYDLDVFVVRVSVFVGYARL